MLYMKKMITYNLINNDVNSDKYYEVANRISVKVDDFIDEAVETYLGREDYLFVIRGKSEYYLNMLGAQILNRCYEHEFESTEKKYVFLPGCMTFMGNSNCRAQKSGYG